MYGKEDFADVIRFGNLQWEAYTGLFRARMRRMQEGQRSERGRQCDRAWSDAATAEERWQPFLKAGGDEEQIIPGEAPEGPALWTPRLRPHGLILDSDLHNYKKISVLL